MTEGQDKSTKSQLAIALAQGVSVTQWARAHEVPRSTVYRWASEPEVRKEIEAYRRGAIDRAVGVMTKRSTWAVGNVVSLASDAESESVRLRANRAILADLMAVSKYSDLEQRITEIEEQLAANKAPRCADSIR